MNAESVIEQLEKLSPEENANPWKSMSLEWTIPSPPPFYNFEHIPTITAGPYEYGHSEGKKGH